MGAGLSRTVGQMLKELSVGMLFLDPVAAACYYSTLPDARMIEDRSEVNDKRRPAATRDMPLARPALRHV